MALFAGKQSEKSEVIRCVACRDSIRMEKGDFIPTCQTCGNNSFEPRKGGNKTSGKSRKGHRSGDRASGRTPQPSLA